MRLWASGHSWLAFHGWDVLASAGVRACRRGWVLWIRFGRCMHALYAAMYSLAALILYQYIVCSGGGAVFT